MQATLIRILRQRNLLAGLSMLAVSIVALMSAGCGGGPKKGSEPQAAADSKAAAESKTAAEPTTLKVAYLGLTCEAPIFVAQEKGFFKEQGLNVELVKTDWDGLRDGLGLGRFDANHTLIMYLLKPIEQGLDVKITGGIHTGCLRIQAGTKTEIQSVEDLRGKKIGVPTHMGSPPFLFASRVLAAHGLNPKKDVEWVVLQPDVMGLAVDNGQVDAVATSEPMGSLLLSKDKVRNVADQAVDAPYSDEYCCAAVVSGKLIRRDPAAAAGLTRALLKAAKWVEENTTAAANLSVEKKYIGATAEINAQAIAKLRYMPGVTQCQESVGQAAKEMQLAGLLDPKTDPAKLAQKAWLNLDGVTDAWISGVEVEKIAGGGRPPMLDKAEFAALFGDGKTCCGACCCMK